MALEAAYYWFAISGLSCSYMSAKGIYDRFVKKEDNNYKKAYYGTVSSCFFLLSILGYANSMSKIHDEHKDEIIKKLAKDLTKDIKEELETELSYKIK